jgi:hypothetical protein
MATCPTTSICTGVFYQPFTPNVGPYLHRTTNGGSSWSTKDMTAILTSIACSGTSFCELAGPRGKLAMTVGMSLSMQASPTARDLTAVACPRVSACYAVGAKGTILARKISEERPPSPPQTHPGTWKTIITVGSAGGLAIDRRGTPNRTKWAYTPNPYNRTLIKFGTGGARLASWKYAPPAPYVSPVGVAVGGSGNVFVADGGNNHVVKFDPFGRQLAVFTGFNMPAGVAIDRVGNIYVAEETALRVTKLTPSGKVLARWHIPWVNGTGNGVPVAVAVDGQRNVYVGADCYRDECPPPHGIQYAIIKLNAVGVLLGSLLGNNPYVPIGPDEQRFVTINAVAVDSKNDLYIGSSAIRTPRSDFYSGVLVYTGGVSLQTIYPIPGTSAPTGISFDGRNALYVAQNTQVLRHVP